jgi:hypothetical protein
MMVGNRRAEEVVDHDMEAKPATRALKRALLVALRCVDPDSEKRPTMGHVVRMLEAEDVPSREVSFYDFLFFFFRVLASPSRLVQPLGYWQQDQIKPVLVFWTLYWCRYVA